MVFDTFCDKVYFGTIYALNLIYTYKECRRDCPDDYTPTYYNSKVVKAEPIGLMYLHLSF